MLIKKIAIVSIILLALASKAVAEERSPQWWSTELKVGFWMPTASNTKKFISKCCNIDTMINGGLLYKGRYGLEAGAGFMYVTGKAVGATSGAVSGDSFDLLMVPMETNAVMRFDFVENQVVVPYVKAGVDYVYFRENVSGDKTSGLKTGLHGSGGLQFLVEGIDTDSSLESDYGINDIYFILDAKYGWINSFGKTGLNLSGMTYSAGLLFEF